MGGCPAADTDTIYLQERFAADAKGRQVPEGRAEKDTVEEGTVK